MVANKAIQFSFQMPKRLLIKEISKIGEFKFDILMKQYL
jgi:heme oxygenase